MRATNTEHVPALYACNMSTMRFFSMLLIGMVAFGLLVWIYSEQYKVDICTSRKTARDPIRVEFPKGLLALLNQSANSHSSAPQVQSQKTEQYSKWDYNWDRQARRDGEDITGIPDRTLVLIRHGKYDFQTGKLTELGKQQANLTGKRLKELGMPYRVIIHSPLIRAVQTAEILHTHLNTVPLQLDDIIQEGGPVPPRPTITYWSLPEKSYHIDGPRMESAFRKYFYRPEKSQKQQSFDILVGHGNIFRFFALRALQLPPSAWMRLFIAHASITVIHCNADGTVSVNHLGDSGHLQRDQVTF